MSTTWGVVAPSMFDWSEGLSAEDGTPAVATPVPSLSDITQAFCSDMRGMKPLPHERRQLRRIAEIVKRDRRMAGSAFVLLKKRANAMRAALRRR